MSEGFLRTDTVSFHFQKPEEISQQRLSRIESLVLTHGAVGRAFVKENLRSAHMVSYACDLEGNVIGTVILKNQKPHYRRRIEAATGLDLSGYLERGYTTVIPEWRGMGVGNRLIRGLIERTPFELVYVTIDMKNVPAMELARKNGMRLAGGFLNRRTGNNIGVFINRERDGEPASSA